MPQISDSAYHLSRSVERHLSIHPTATVPFQREQGLAAPAPWQTPPELFGPDRPRGLSLRSGATPFAPRPRSLPGLIACL